MQRLGKLEPSARIGWVKDALKDLKVIMEVSLAAAEVFPSSKSRGSGDSGAGLSELGSELVGVAGLGGAERNREPC